jgi:hypothetical protein
VDHLEKTLDLEMAAMADKLVAAVIPAVAVAAETHLLPRM